MLSYQTKGKPSDKPLIFLHGLGASSEQITSSLNCPEQRCLITPDMPGHGQSLDYSTNDLSFERFADLVIELMDHFGIESTDMGGLSMGAGITLNLALRYPQRVKKIILLRPSWIHHPQPEHLKLVAYAGQWIDQLGAQAAEQKLLADPDFQKLNRDNPPMAGTVSVIFSRVHCPLSSAVLRQMWQDSPFADLKQLSTIHNPALALTTSRDELHPQAIADAITAQLPNAQQAELPPRYYRHEAYNLALNSIVGKFLAD